MKFVSRGDGGWVGFLCVWVWVGGGGGGGRTVKCSWQDHCKGHICIVRQRVFVMFIKEFLVQILHLCHTMQEFFNTMRLSHTTLHL